MNILFVNHHSLDSNSGIHIFNLANQLIRFGVDCSVCVPGDKESVANVGTPLFKVFDFNELIQKKQLHHIDLIHAWTPREIVRKMTEQLAEQYHCPYVVHLEDNEDALLQAQTGLPISQLRDREFLRRRHIIRPHMADPIRYREFLSASQGVSVIMDTLLEFSPAGKPCQVIWAGYDDQLDWEQAPDIDFRDALGIDGAEYIIVYTGNVHQANHREVFSLYLAVGLLNRRGIRTRLVRTGRNFIPLTDEDTWNEFKGHVIELGVLPRRELPRLLSIADVLVQPGRSDIFNDYRFPSKLPEYLASGKPVLLPAANIGRFLQDGEECILLKEGTAIELASLLEKILPDRELRLKLGTAGQQFAERNLRWYISAQKLHTFYLELST